MERVARDDEQAFAELVTALAPALLRFVQRAASLEHGDAEDVVQEVFIRVWRARRRWQPRAAVRTYVFTIATRLCLNRRRGRRRAPVLESLATGAPEDGFEVPDRGADPERVAASRQIRAAIAREVSDLPPNQRAALLLRHELELSYHEIAAALDTSSGAVESLLSRARARLRSRLASWVTAGNAVKRG